MSVTVPNALALTNIADGAAIVASDHRNNYSAVQVGVNGLVAMFTAAPTKGDLLVSLGGGVFDKLAVGTNGQELVADNTQPSGLKWQTPPGVAASYSKYTTLIDLVSSVTELDLLQAAGYTIAGNTLGITGMARVTLIGDLKNNSGGAINFTPRVYWGGSAYFDNGAFSITSSTVRSPFRVELTIANLGVTGSQFIEGVFHNIGTPTAVANAGIGGVSSEFRFGSNGTAAQDTTTAKTIRVTGQFGTSSANVELRIFQSLVEIL